MKEKKRKKVHPQQGRKGKTINPNSTVRDNKGWNTNAQIVRKYSRGKSI
jgi:hypothetical protein